MNSKQLLAVLTLAPIGLALGVRAGVYAYAPFSSPAFFQDLCYLVLAALAYYSGVLDSDYETGSIEVFESVAIIAPSVLGNTASDAGLETK